MLRAEVNSQFKCATAYPTSNSTVDLTAKNYPESLQLSKKVKKV
jgi:hypothetical protein